MARTKKSAPTTAETPPAPEPAAENTEQPVTLIGRLVADPVLRATHNGVPVTNFRIAVNHDDGSATFHNIVAWKRTAQSVATYMRKGRLVEVRGREHRRVWTDQHGAEHWCAVEISAFTVQFLGQPQTPDTEARA